MYSSRAWLCVCGNTNQANGAYPQVTCQVHFAAKKSSHITVKARVNCYFYHYFISEKFWRKEDADMIFFLFKENITEKFDRLVWLTTRRFLPAETKASHVTQRTEERSQWNKADTERPCPLLQCICKRRPVEGDSPAVHKEGGCGLRLTAIGCADAAPEVDQWRHRGHVMVWPRHVVVLPDLAAGPSLHTWHDQARVFTVEVDALVLQNPTRNDCWIELSVTVKYIYIYRYSHFK